MKRRLVTLFLSIAMVFAMSLAFVGCDLSSLDSYSNSGEESPYPRGVDMLLNGHVGEEPDDGTMVTPCCFYFKKRAILIQTRYYASIPNDSLGLYTLPNGYQYLYVQVNVGNASSSEIHASMGDFQVYADGKLCQDSYIIENNLPYSAEISSSRNVSISNFYSVPKDAEKIELEFSPSYGSDKLIFVVSDNGEISDEDMEAIKEANDMYKEAGGDISKIKKTNRKPIKITSSTSDSCYHSNSANKDYSVDLTYDGDYSTCWQDGSEDDAVGETLTYNFDETDIKAVAVVNGNRKDSSSFEKNNRLSKATLTFYLNDKEVYSTKMNFGNDKTPLETLLELDSPVHCSSVVITIDSVYKGTEFSDTGIAEVMFYNN